tara:strand:+ start:332 stop:994 length:663 start_codon:yes stop_codon:yes gene_type:complete
MGNGPSLTLELINQIKRRTFFSFAVNGFCLIFNKTNFRPSAVCMSNYNAIQIYGRFYPSSVLKFFKSGWQEKVSNSHFYRSVFDLPFTCNHDQEYHEAPFIKDGNFTLDPLKENFCGDTVILDFAIPIAFYMGFREIILCGTDTDYSNGYFDKNYIKQKNTGKREFKSMHNSDYSIAVSGYRYVKKFIESKGRNIYKLTKSNRLNFIETINFDDILTETD